MSSPSFPAQLRLAGRRCLVVGAGSVAARKIAGLRQAGAVVTVVAPDAVDEIVADDGVSWHQRHYVRGEAASYTLVITATDDPVVNRQVYRDGEAAGIFVNSADDPDNCSFTLPAVARRGPVQISVATDGRSPAVSGWLRRRLESRLEPELDALVRLAAEVRTELRDAVGTAEVGGWDEALDAALVYLQAGDSDNAAAALRAGVGLAELREVAS
ncbi:MAG: precorrin-2 dehydrogenase/sirohydrochlorin ferrochelatase family protein [Acidimicrobiales bacterium]